MNQSGRRSASPPERLWTFGQAAAELGLSRPAVSDLVRSLGLKPSRYPASPKGLGLTERQLEQIRSRLVPLPVQD